MSKQHILQVVIKNTSTMDFSVPVLRELAQSHPEIKLTVLYCVMDRRNILRNGMFWDRLFKQYGIAQVDFCDYLKWPWRPFKALLRRLFSGSKGDKIHFHEAWNFYRRNAHSPTTYGFLYFLLREYTFSGLLTNVLQSALSFLETRCTLRLVDLAEILPKLAPDIILFDNRSVTEFPGRDELYRWMYQNRVKVGLLPHAPHLRDPISEFCAFDEKGEALPDFCEFWVPLKFGTPWQPVPERRRQFHITGYPGLDAEWLAWCREGMGQPRTERLQGEPLRCLFVMRRYLPKGEVRPEGMDPYIVDFEDFQIPLMAMLEGFSALRQEVKLILKPHPANNYSVLAKDLQRLGVKNWEISHESIYPLLSQVDIVVGLFSTVLLVPAMAGIPTVLIKTKLQDVVHAEWPLLEGLYTKLTLYVNNNKKTKEVLSDAINLADGVCLGIDCQLLRYYYSDNATSVVVNRILSAAK